MKKYFSICELPAIRAVRCDLIPEANEPGPEGHIRFGWLVQQDNTGVPRPYLLVMGASFRSLPYFQELFEALAVVVPEQLSLQYVVGLVKSFEYEERPEPQEQAA